MKIYKKENILVVEIPLKQKIQNPYMEGEDLGETDNLVGVIAGDLEQGIYQSIDMDYKGKPNQLGMPIVTTCMEDADFRKLCKELGIDCQEYPSCTKCHKTLWGSFTMNDKGNVCFECEDE
jgi:hypothetical protein